MNRKPSHIGTLKYLQRGVFVDCAASSSGSLLVESRRIEFPPDPEFRVIREGTEVELLGECAIEETFLAKARRAAYICETGEFGNPTECGGAWMGGPPNGPPSSLPDLHEWIELVGEMLYWLAIAPTSDGQRAHLDVLGHIVRNNRSLMRHFADQCLVSASELESEGEREKAADHRILAGLVIDQFRQQ